MNITQRYGSENIFSGPPAVIARKATVAKPFVLSYKAPDALLRRYATENKCDLETARKAFEALKQFLIVCTVAKHSCSPSIAIDAMWHEFLMFSEEYYNFCLHGFGALIHHFPTEMMMNDDYRGTRRTASRLFGDLDIKFWPKKGRNGALCSGGDCGAKCGDKATRC